jgi:signal transduction histidine kinase
MTSLEQSAVAPSADHPAAPAPSAERHRLATLHRYQILDTAREAAFDDITRLAALICGTPMALVSLVDQDRQWFKSELGLGVSETPIGSSICAHAIQQDGLFVVPDTLADARFVHNPLVTSDPNLRFYAGAPLRTADGVPLGTVCVLDSQPRALSAEQAEALQALARQTMAQIELRQLLAQSQESNHYRRQLMAIAGHDLKTPVRTAAYAIRKVQRTLTPEQGGPLNVATEALARIDREFSQLAAMAGTEGALVAPDETDVALADVLQPLLDQWREAALAKGLRLRYVPTKLRVRSHPALLSTLLGNLLGNAVKYTEKGSVLVGCRRRGDHVVVDIIDSGLGMDERQTGDMFGAFHQVDPRSEGLGLGLWIVRSTAESLGHQVRVESTPGRGSRFSVEMPRA